MYEALERELSTETALIQASYVLDLAGIFAVENRDATRLHELADTWIKLADFLAQGPPVDGRKSDFPTGFQITNKEEEDDARDDGDEEQPDPDQD